MTDLFVETFRSIRAHSLRFTLTSLGIVWGAFMLTYLSASTAGTERHYVESMTAGGERNARPVELEDDDAIRVQSLRDVGMNQHARTIRNFEPARGRFLSLHDVERSARVAYIGPQAEALLFPQGSALGQQISIRGVGFRVVGVGSPKTEMFENAVSSDNRKIVIPYTTAQRWLTQDDQIGEIVYTPQSAQLSWSTIDRVRELTGIHHDFHPSVDSALWFYNVEESLRILRGIHGAIRVFFFVAGMVTMLVGAVGLMNIMLVVVGERRAEIGLRKAVGARSHTLFAQFLAESTAVCGLAGVTGTLLGAVRTQRVARRLKKGRSRCGSPRPRAFGRRPC